MYSCAHFRAEVYPEAAATGGYVPTAHVCWSSMGIVRVTRGAHPVQKADPNGLVLGITHVGQDGDNDVGHCLAERTQELTLVVCVCECWEGKWEGAGRGGHWI